MRARLALGLIASVLWLPAATAQTLRCGNRLVSPGASVVQVLRACGAPSFRDPWVASDGLGLGPPMVEWTYNPGPQQLIRVVLFGGDQVAATYTDGYGFTTSGGFPASGSCEPTTTLRPGLSKYRLLSACGPPIDSVSWFTIANQINEPGYRTNRHDNSGPLVFRERWTYNFGANRFIRFVTLDNARVVDVELGGRGFDR